MVGRVDETTPVVACLRASRPTGSNARPRADRGRRGSPVPNSTLAANPQPAFSQDWRELWREQSVYGSTMRFCVSLENQQAATSSRGFESLPRRSATQLSSSISAGRERVVARAPRICRNHTADQLLIEHQIYLMRDHRQYRVPRGPEPQAGSGHRRPYGSTIPPGDPAASHTDTLGVYSKGIQFMERTSRVDAST